MNKTERLCHGNATLTATLWRMHMNPFGASGPNNLAPSKDDTNVECSASLANILRRKPKNRHFSPFFRLASLAEGNSVCSRAPACTRMI